MNDENKNIETQNAGDAPRNGPASGSVCCVHCENLRTFKSKEKGWLDVCLHGHLGFSKREDTLKPRFCSDYE